MTDAEYDELFNPQQPKEPAVDDISETRSIENDLRFIRERLKIIEE